MGELCTLAPAGTAGADQRPARRSARPVRSGRCWLTCTPISIVATPSCASPNASGMFADALKATAADRLKWTHDDLIARHGFRVALRLCAWRLGHPHPSRFGAGASPAKLAGRSATFVRQWQDRVALQAVSLLPIDCFSRRVGRSAGDAGRGNPGVFWGAGDARAASAGGFTAHRSTISMRCSTGCSDLRPGTISTSICIVDETNDPKAAALPIRGARAALRHDYQDRVTCGHCCSLAVQPDVQAERTLDLLAEAQSCGGSRFRRSICISRIVAAGAHAALGAGVTLVHEMRKRGVVCRGGGRQLPRLLLRLRRPRHDRHVFGRRCGSCISTIRLRMAPALVGPAPAKIAKLPDHGRIRRRRGRRAPDRVQRGAHSTKSYPAIMRIGS